MKEYVLNARKGKRKSNKVSEPCKCAKCRKLHNQQDEVSQQDVDNGISDFIVQGIHPLSTVEQPAFIRLVSSELHKYLKAYNWKVLWLWYVGNDLWNIAVQFKNKTTLYISI